MAYGPETWLRCNDIERRYSKLYNFKGNEYRGNWQYDQREGFGEEFFTEGLMYKGEFKQNKAHGKGTYW